MMSWFLVFLFLSSQFRDTLEFIKGPQIIINFENFDNLDQIKKFLSRNNFKTIRLIERLYIFNVKLLKKIPFKKLTIVNNSLYLDFGQKGELIFGAYILDKAEEFWIIEIALVHEIGHIIFFNLPEKELNKFKKIFDSLKNQEKNKFAEGNYLKKYDPKFKYLGHPADDPSELFSSCLALLVSYPKIDSIKINLDFEVINFVKKYSLILKKVLENKDILDK